MSAPVKNVSRTGAKKILAALILVAIASSFSPPLGLLLCISAFAASIVAIIYPLPSIGLPTRKFSFGVLIFVGFLGSMIPALMHNSEKGEGALDPDEISHAQGQQDNGFHAAKAMEVAEAEAERNAESRELVRQTLRNAIDEGRWHAAQLALADIPSSERDEAFINEMEARAVALVKALPAPAAGAIKNGCEFLALLKPDSEEYAERNAEIAEGESARKAERRELVRQTLRNAIDEGRWYGAGVAFAETGPSERDEAFMSEIETRAAALIKAIPASDTEANKNGYEFLALLQPENKEYAEKVAKYRKRNEDEKAQAVKRVEQERQAVISKLIKKEDKVEGVAFFTHPAAPKHLNSRSTVYLHIGRQGQGAPWLRMKVQYTASDWLFVENVYAWFDGIKEPLISGPFERDNNATIWDWRDVTPDGRQLLTLESLADAKEAILRFEGGQYRKDVTLSASDKKAIREVLAAYEAMRTGR